MYPELVNGEWVTKVAKDRADLAFKKNFKLKFSTGQLYNTLTFQEVRDNSN